MKRRGSSGKPRKKWRTDKAKARKALIARAPVADLQKQLTQRTRERDEALEQQTATSEVLRAISSFHGASLGPVFQYLCWRTQPASARPSFRFICCSLEMADMFSARRVAQVPGVALRRIGHEAGDLSSSTRAQSAGSARPRLLETKQVVHVADTGCRAVPY